MSSKISTTLSPAQIDASEYDAIYFVGGHGTMWDFPDNPQLATIAREIYESGGFVAAVCHGPSALVGITLSDGRALVDGKELAAFTNEEEAEAGLADVVPFLLQTRLEEEGAKHTGTAKFQPWVVMDGRLVTGQNPASAAGVAEKVVDALGGE
jgi:putative intracellular protease/amidase